MQELSILKHFMNDRGLEYRYFRNIIKIDNLQKEYQILFKVCDDLYQLFPTMQVITPDELKSYIRYKMPTYRDVEFLFGLIDSAVDTDVGEGVSELMMQQLAEKYIATKITNLMIPVLEGKKTDEIPKVRELYQEYEDLVGALTAQNELSGSTESLVELIEETQMQTGLTWPLSVLNDSMGNAQLGTSGLIFARPETGKTSLGLQVAAHWAYCMKNNDDYLALYLGNEEGIKKCRLRYYQSVLGCKEEHILAKPDVAQVTAATKGSERTQFFGNIRTTRHIEQLCKHHKPTAIFIDQTPKIYLPGQSDKDYLRLGQLYKWVRDFAKDNQIIVVNLCQADAKAENLQWLSQVHISGSKTDVPGELDWAAGVGVVNEPGMGKTRFISLCRNKSGPHRRKQVYFDFERCRYFDTAPKPKGKP